jgi:hypothetical protein
MLITYAGKAFRYIGKVSSYYSLWVYRGEILRSLARSGKRKKNIAAAGLYGCPKNNRPGAVLYVKRRLRMVG